METTAARRPVQAPPSNARPQHSPGSPSSLEWPDGALELAQALQRSLAISDRDWHRLKSQRSRRAAEQLAAALIQLLAADQPGRPTPTPARQQAIALAEHALGWLRADLSDPGCPDHGR